MMYKCATQGTMSRITAAGNLKKLLVVAMLLIGISGNSQMQPLKVTANKRYFQTKDGKPFFWMGDTGWLLFVKCKREDATLYLDTRRKQGFNVVQAMLLHDFNNTKNAYGDWALENFDVSKPAITKGNSFSDSLQYDYWDHVDYVVDEAAKRGIYMALVPTWGSNVKSGKINEQQAEVYAKFLPIPQDFPKGGLRAGALTRPTVCLLIGWWMRQTFRHASLRPRLCPRRFLLFHGRPLGTPPPLAHGTY